MGRLQISTKEYIVVVTSVGDLTAEFTDTF